MPVTADQKFFWPESTWKPLLESNPPVMVISGATIRVNGSSQVSLRLAATMFTERISCEEEELYCMAAEHGCRIADWPSVSCLNGKAEFDLMTAPMLRS